MSQQHLYLTDSSLVQIHTTVLAVRRFGDGTGIALEHNLHRPRGGGEPADRGSLIFEDGSLAPVIRVDKSDNHTWIVVPTIEVREGAALTSKLDAPYRHDKRALHTLIHTTLAVVCRRLPAVTVQVADVSDDADAATVVVACDDNVSANHIAEIDSEVRSIVLAARPVTIEKVKSIALARERYPTTFRLSDRYQLSGRVRLVVIDGIDANPCSGCHADTTRVGPYIMARLSDGYGPNHFAVRLRRTEDWMYWYGGSRSDPA